jgi:hypothetical protein
MVYNTIKLKEGVLNVSIPSTFVVSAATSSIRTKKDQSRNAFVSTGQQLDKALCMPNGAVEVTAAMDKLHHELRPPAKDQQSIDTLSAYPSLLTKITLRFLTRTR